MFKIPSRPLPVTFIIFFCHLSWFFFLFSFFFFLKYFVICHLSFVLNLVSFFLFLFSFFLCHLSFVLNLISFFLFPFSFVICLISFVLYTAPPCQLHPHQTGCNKGKKLLWVIFSNMLIKISLWRLKIKKRLNVFIYKHVVLHIYQFFRVNYKVFLNTNQAKY